MGIGKDDKNDRDRDRDRTIADQVNATGSTFLQGFVELNGGTEVPPLFALWSGLGCISAALGRNLWTEMGHYQFYSNLAIVLVAGAGRMRKSTAIDVGADMLRELSPAPNILPNKCSTEKLIDSLQQIDSSDPTRLCRESAIGFLLVDELVTLLNKRSYDQGLGEVMMPLFDAKKEFTYGTIARGDLHLKNVCVGMLGASTVELLREAIPREAIGGGLTSRIIFVYCNTPMPPKLWTTFDDNKRRLRGLLLDQLRSVAALREGVCTFTDDAKFVLNENYEHDYHKSPFRVDPYLKAYASRRHIHIMKVAMCLSAMDPRTQASRTVTENHVRSAIGLVESTEGSLQLMMRLITSSEEGTAIDRVYSIIEGHGGEGITHQDLLEMVVHEFKASQVQEIMDTLKAMDRVAVGYSGDVRKARYRAIKKPMKEKEKEL
jgi:hypothetical protein